MGEKELIDKVIKKLQKRPDLKNVNAEYMIDVVSDCVNDVKNFINSFEDEELEADLLTPISDLSVIRINLTSTEGLTSSSKVGISESYLDDIPKAIRVKLCKYRRLRL